jgi:hypothetical protein
MRLSLLLLAACSSPANPGPGSGDGGSSSTALPFDCREENDEARCERFDDVEAQTIGSGVSLANGTGSLSGGFVDAANVRLVLAAFDYTEQGYVLAVDLDTGDRTLVSGAAHDPRTGNETPRRRPRARPRVGRRSRPRRNPLHLRRPRPHRDRSRERRPHRDRVQHPVRARGRDLAPRERRR